MCSSYTVITQTFTLFSCFLKLVMWGLSMSGQNDKRILIHFCSKDEQKFGFKAETSLYIYINIIIIAF